MMTLTQKKKLFWMAFFIAAMTFLSVFSGILTPFIAAVIITYLVYPIQSGLVKRKVPAILATGLTFCIMIAAVCTLVIVIFPIFQEQIATFVKNLPVYIEKTSAHLTEFVRERFPNAEIENDLKDTVWAAIAPHIKDVDAIVGKALSSGKALFNIVAILFLTPIVTFYILHSWDRTLVDIESLFPKKSAAKIKQIMKEINRALSGFIRGQSTVCCLFAAYYSGVLMFLNIEMALSIGCLTGLGLFIPYVGFGFGLLLALLVALQAGGVTLALKVLVGYMIGQIVESNFVTPNVVGDKTQLSPVTIIFAIMAGGYLFGFAGILFAVPTAATVRILLKHGIAAYKKTDIYLK